MQRFNLNDLSPTMRKLNNIPAASIPSTKSIPSISAARPDEREAELQKLCEAELSRRGIAFLHLSPRAREKKGWPDLTFAVYGRATAVELKTTLGQLSEDQERCHAELKASGWDVRVIRSYETFRAIVEGVQIDKDQLQEGFL